MAERVTATRLSCRGVRKSFGGTAALVSADLEVNAGEVHALLGENGAGKSTLTKIISGAIAADAGTMELDGAPYAPKSPQDARASGVAIVYQEPLVATHLSVAENVLLGAEPARFGVILKNQLRERAERALELVRAESGQLDVDTPAS